MTKFPRYRLISAIRIILITSMVFAGLRFAQGLWWLYQDRDLKSASRSSKGKYTPSLWSLTDSPSKLFPAKQVPKQSAAESTEESKKIDAELDKIDAEYEREQKAKAQKAAVAKQEEDAAGKQRTAIAENEAQGLKLLKQLADESDPAAREQILGQCTELANARAAVNLPAGDLLTEKLKKAASRRPTNISTDNWNDGIIGDTITFHGVVQADAFKDAWVVYGKQNDAIDEKRVLFLLRPKPDNLTPGVEVTVSGSIAVDSFLNKKGGFVIHSRPPTGKSWGDVITLAPKTGVGIK